MVGRSKNYNSMIYIKNNVPISVGALERPIMNRVAHLEAAE